MRTVTLLWLALTLVAAAQTEISWYSDWRQGLAAARASGKPILLMSAAPQCKGVSGIW